ncbi:MAG: cobaltochelatase subunit CobN [Pseudomonadota bacterium]
MHLLAAQKGSVNDDTDEAIDLEQSPGDICFLSAADTDLSALANAYSEDGPTLRLVNIMQLTHPMSVDIWVEKTAAKSKLIVARLLGGLSYWQYLGDALQSACSRYGIQLALLPGDDKHDSALLEYSTTSTADWEKLWAFLREGGADNAKSFLSACADIIDGRKVMGEARPLLKAGVYRESKSGERPTVAVVFYRALMQSGQTAAIDALCNAVIARDLNVLAVFVTSLKDDVSQATVLRLFDKVSPDIVINLTGFAVSSPGADRVATVLESGGAVVLQAILASQSREAWETSPQGLSARDLAMSVALPEVDGRVFTRAISFKAVETFDERVECNIVAHAPDADGIGFVADLASRWIDLRRKPNSGKSVALVLANYPNKDGRLANGVGLDTPASTVRVLQAMDEVGYIVRDIPPDSSALMDIIKSGPTNVMNAYRNARETIDLRNYQAFFDTLPGAVQSQVTERWGAPESDPFFRDGKFHLPLTKFGSQFVGVQPARGYNIDPKETYHSPDLVPPHGYLAFYAHLRKHVDAVVHMGKHGNLEWLPGKALALSNNCFPGAVLGPIPHVYPFIVNDPGEGTQAKRRTSAVIIDHLTPPLTRAESYGPLKDLEVLVDEFYQAIDGDPRRVRILKKRILDLVQDIGLGHDVGIAVEDETETALEKLDAYLCELKEMQIRDGLHVFGEAPSGALLTDLVTALARVPRGAGEGRDNSLQRALASDFDLGFDPLDTEMSKPWLGSRPRVLTDVSDDHWRTHGDTVERIEILAQKLVGRESEPNPGWKATSEVLQEIDARLRPSVEACGNAEIEGFLNALDGCFVPPGSSGAPTRGRPDVLPTGRNFFSVDCRAVPTETAWELGRKSADMLVTRYVQDHGEWPNSMALTAWGTSNMRTGGDDIAQAMALIGVRPVWDGVSRRVTGFEAISTTEMGRPRVDVTLRISGFFRDAFPEQIALLDHAIRFVAKLEEPAGQNPIAARYADDLIKHQEAGLDDRAAALAAGHRIFGSKPGAYGAGLQALIDERGWQDRSDLAEAYLVWGSYAYGAKAEGEGAREIFERRLAGVQAVIQNQDNREHDLLDSDDYYQFEGGITAAIEQVSGQQPANYHNDHSRPERPVIRTLEDEIGRIVRARVINPKWIAGVMRHGYKGAFEMAATVDYMFAFAATTGAVKDHHFDAVHQAYLQDEQVCEFMREANPDALREMSERLLEAIDRGLWTPRSNSAQFELRRLSDSR